jgi:transglutaminase-like putative cysteine protease
MKPEDLVYDYLVDGKLVIVDLTMGEEAVVSEQLERIVEGITGKSVWRFNNLDSDEEMPRIQIFLEEAHRYFGEDRFDTTDDDSPYVQLAKEGRKFNLGLIYATQEVSAVDDRVLANTANWMVTHLNSQSEINDLSDYYDFEVFDEGIRKIDNQQGFSRVRTDSNSFTVPTQISEFAPSWIKQVVGLPEDYTRMGALNPSAQTGIGGGIGLDPHTYGNLDTRVHFEAEVPTTTYWRSDAYSSYTGSGWKREVDTQPYDEPLSFDGESDGQIEYEVTLKKESTAIPAPWRPETVSGVDNLSLTSQAGIRSSDSVPSDTTYTGVSNVPIDNPEMLQQAGTEYLEEIEETYTQLPKDTPSRLRELTEEIAGDAQTPYDVAITLIDWLKSEKQYSLEAAATSGNIADEFIFEMDEGYCEHFATALVVMLRSQDIPARYTVGYSPGDEIDDGVYEIRGMHAHAWAEVYFPDFGWVKLEPTPSDDRQAAHEEALSKEGNDSEDDEVER